jgi:hypothetical protein
VPIFKSGDKTNPYSYRTIMIILVLSKMYEIILENNISIWIERHRERDKGQTTFKIYHSTVDNLITIRIISV